MKYPYGWEKKIKQVEFVDLSYVLDKYMYLQTVCGYKHPKSKFTLAEI